MSAGNGAPDRQPLWILLALISPRRLVLAGPEGPTLGAALDWARRSGATRVLRGRQFEELGPGDLIVCERAGLLPEDGRPDLAALVPTREAPAAQERGWRTLFAPAGDVVLVSRSAVEPRLDAYVRARLAMSEQLDALGSAGPLEGARANPAPVVDPRAASAAADAPSTRADRVSVIVPVYNAAAELRRCLRSLSRYTTWPCELVLIDDASTDPAVADVLAEAAGLSGVRVLRNAVNLGFTETVNRGLRATGGDVVLVNSDTEVGPRWLEHLVNASRSRRAVATVTPVSDNAGAFAVPVSGEPNATPLGLDTAGVARLIAQAVGPRPTAPTGSGFCMYVKRAALDDVGLLDGDAFPRGYGEENDFCMRALRAGWTHLVDGRTFVAHVRRASFGDERLTLERVARDRIDARYPEYTELVRQYVKGEALARLRQDVREAYARPEPPRSRVLSVIHEGGGGTWTANLELARALELEWDPLVLTSDRRTLRLWRMADGRLQQAQEWTLERSIRATDFSRRDYAEIVESVLDDHEVELVHVRHLFKHSFDLPRISAQRGIPVVFSFHDFYFTCPTVNLLDDHDRYCAAQCTPGDGECRIPGAGLEGLPHLKHSYVHQWREEVQSMLGRVDAFVTTSEHAREVHLRALPSLRGRRFELIEHGRLLRQRVGIAQPPEAGGPIRILVVANLDVHKGADYMRALVDADRAGRLEFHLIGAVPESYQGLGHCYGSVPADSLADRAQEIAPAFAGCFSITPETYSHSLTEAWAMGLPVLATDLGALRERIGKHGGGELLGVDDPDQAVARIYAAADDPQRYARLREQASLTGCATVADMGDAYTALYRRVVDARRALTAIPGTAAPAELAPGVARLLAVVPGGHGVHPGSTYVRVVQRYRHPSVSPKLSLSLRCADQTPLATEPDLVLVQRTALDPAETEEFVATLADRGTPLVLDLDDHLLLRGDDPDYERHQASLELLVAAAALVLVSTEPLRKAYTSRARAVAVVPNLIDERLFLSGLAHGVPSVGRRDHGPIQLLYMGSSTHGEDLELLRPVLDELARRRPGGFQLNVVGGEPVGPGQDWYRRVTVPDASKPYPRFVAWLRQQRPAWDIAVAPLRDTEFNRHKSDLKYLEYSALGLPAVYSDREPYSSVQDGGTGLLVDGSVAAWSAALERLADDRAEREAIATAAFADVISHRLLRHGAEELLALLCPLAEPMMAG